MHQNFKDNFFVGLQFLLFGLFFLKPDLGYTLPEVIKYPGLLIFLMGGITALASMIQLNRNLTAFPTPKEKAFLYTGGLYGFVRHPIYTGVILIFLGLTFYSLSVYKLLITCSLVILFYFKSDYEEQQLKKKYQDYEEYKNKTGRFFPKFKFK
ncbi:MAG: isoprenylcysteine carboxylmethyltransferase family protein [Saprospiraceae bacterium]|nr:isoprenylcysteine carboxylmethyltransferase family protein [Saprospiraceae bacterium]